MLTPARLRTMYQHPFRDPRRERLFLASCSFLGSFVTTRGITHLIRAGRGPFHNLSHGSRHIHHLVWGISALELVGYLWLHQWGTGKAETSRTGSAATSVLYGLGSALTLDEFALWLNLEDVYWARQGRESIDAVVIFGALLSIGFWGRPFLHALARELGRETRQAAEEAVRTAEEGGILPASGPDVV